MHGVDVIRSALRSTQHLVTWFLGDLDDADLLVAPVAGANHIAWQVGHLLVAERYMISTELPDAAYPELPAGFNEQHKNDSPGREGTTGFASKATYLDLLKGTREATIAALDKLTDADLDRPTKGKMAPFAPTLGAIFLLASNHSLMHAGQFSVVRRKLGKPVLM